MGTKFNPVAAWCKNWARGLLLIAAVLEEGKTPQHRVEWELLKDGLRLLRFLCRHMRRAAMEELINGNPEEAAKAVVDVKRLGEAVDNVQCLFEALAPEVER